MIDPKPGQIWRRRNGTHFKVSEVRGGWVRCWPVDGIKGERRTYVKLADFHRRGFTLESEP